ncbi:MAG: DUF4442 domain-containing protein [Chitinophagales bacterium]|nr:DUF4442 domain-containing protein [Chitinophagales bacterium]
MNKLNKSLNQLNFLPDFLQMKGVSTLIGTVVPFVGTSNIHFEKITNNELIVSVANKRKVRNHIGQVHAAAMALLAETATGILVGYNLPDDKLPLIKTMNINFVRRTKGAIKAVATLTDEQILNIMETDKGEVSVAVKVTDETDNEVIKAEMIWAWIPKKK